MEEPKRRVFVEFYKPGDIEEEVEVREIDAQKRDPHVIKDEMPEDSYAFQFYDKLTGLGADPKGNVKRHYGKRTNNSPRYYVDAETFTLNQLQQKFPDEEILINNMKRRSWDKVVKTRAGNFQPFFEDHHRLIRMDSRKVMS